MAWILRVLFFHFRSEELKTSYMILPLTYLCLNPPASLSQSSSCLRPGFLSALFSWYWWCWVCCPPSWLSLKSWCPHPSTPPCRRSASSTCTWNSWRREQSRRWEKETVNRISTLQRQAKMAASSVMKEGLSLKGKWTFKALFNFMLGFTPPAMDRTPSGEN